MRMDEILYRHHDCEGVHLPRWLTIKDCMLQFCWTNLQLVTMRWVDVLFLFFFVLYCSVQRGSYLQCGLGFPTNTPVWSPKFGEISIFQFRIVLTFRPKDFVWTYVEFRISSKFSKFRSIFEKFGEIYISGWVNYSKSYCITDLHSISVKITQQQTGPFLRMPAMHWRLILSGLNTVSSRWTINVWNLATCMLFTW